MKILVQKKDENLENRSAEQRDLLAIWPKLAKRMKEEYRLAGVPSRQARRMFKDWIKAGTADALLEDTNPVAIMAWEMREGSMITSFAGTDAFFEPRFVRPFSRYIANLQHANGNCPLVSHSHSTHPQVVKWFATLGFDLDSPSDGVYRVFVRSPQ